MIPDRETLARTLYAVHEKCRLSGFYEWDGSTEYEDGSRKQVDWGSLPETVDDIRRVDKAYFRGIAEAALRDLTQEGDMISRIERLAQVLSSVHAYTPHDDAFWSSLPENSTTPNDVDRSFFRRLAAKVIQDPDAE